MDGHPNPKKCKYQGEIYSETRYSIIKWLEKELPKLNGSVLNVGAGNWQIPKQLLNMSQISNYTTFDKKWYGKSKNKVDVYGDIQDMPKDWANKWDNIICLEVLECISNPFKAFDEMFRVLKPGGVLLLSCPFNYRAFGDGTWEKPKPGIVDYWRITKQGLELLAQKFSKVRVDGFGGSGNHDRFGHCMYAVKEIKK